MGGGVEGGEVGGVDRDNRWRAKKPDGLECGRKRERERERERKRERERERETGREREREIDR